MLIYAPSAALRLGKRQEAQPRAILPPSGSAALVCSGANILQWEEMMPERLGSGEFVFEVHDNWAKIPDEIALGDCAAVGVDKNDNVYAFNRGDHPIAVFDKDGNLLRTWGEGVFSRPHGVHVGPDNTIWLTDDGDHTVRHCTLDGKVLMTLGIPGKPAPFMSGEPFHRCTHTALSPNGDDLYISDGYGNARI